MKVFKLAIFAAAIGLVAAIGGSYLAPVLFAPRQNLHVDSADPALVARGRYIAQASDCVACHTAKGGKAFAGGLAMQTPIGTIYSTNITPDKGTGIGAYDFADFERAVRQGIRKDGSPLYPAMPYVSYSVLTDEDMQALYAYFISAVQPVAQHNQAATIPWPKNMRWPLAWWRALFGGHRSFTPPEGATPEVARGAYLVEGAGHCGACHTPRGVAFQERRSRGAGWHLPLRRGIRGMGCEEPASRGHRTLRAGLSRRLLTSSRPVATPERQRSAAWPKSFSTARSI